jgi:hypothetical protein
VPYHDLLAEPGYWVRKIAAFTDLGHTQQAVAFIDPKLRRHR